MSEKLGINAFTFDEICESQNFGHGQEFIPYDDYYELFQELDDIKQEAENWKARGDFEFDRAEQLDKIVDQKEEVINDLADRLRERDEDNERLCKILIANGLGYLIEID